MIIGICGKSGSGKTTLANEIIKLTGNKAIHLDIDKVGHRSLLLPNVKEKLVNSFGNSILKKDMVDRKKLAKIVFNSNESMDKLTDITWKYMQIEIDNFLNTNKDKIIIIDWLLLPNSKYLDMCDVKILLDIPYEIRKKRAMKRDNITEEAFDLREQASNLFDEVVIAVMQNHSKKSGLFTLEERLEMIRKLYQNMNNIKVISARGAAVDVALLNECKAIIRGLRSLSDYDYEVQLQQINKEISSNEVNTVCLFADKDYQFISSSMVKEVFTLDKNILEYVDPIVQQKMLIKKRSLIQ